MGSSLEELGAEVTELFEPLRGLTVPDTLSQLAARLAVPKPVPA